MNNNAPLLGIFIILFTACLLILVVTLSQKNIYGPASNTSEMHIVWQPLL